MTRRKTYILAAAFLVAILGVMAVAVACGGTETDGDETEVPTGTALERATEILGREPTGLAATIVEKGEIIVANDSDYAPQSYVDPETNEIIGFDVDVAKGMAEILGLEIQWVHPAWETIPGGLQTGRFDVSIGSMTITPERAETLDFTVPYYYTSGQVFVLKGGTQITGPEDLAGMKVGCGAQTTYYDFLKNETDAEVKTYTTDVNAFPDLLNGNIDFVMTAGPTGQQAILEGKPMEFSGSPLYYEDLAMAVKKGEADLVELLSYAINTMHENGQLTEMSKQWYNGIDLTKKE